MSALAHLARRTACAASSGARVAHRRLPSTAMMASCGHRALLPAGAGAGGALGVRAKTTYINVVLLEDVDYVGEKGEEIAVKRGFARNYLVPKQLALFATKETKKLFKTAPMHEVKVAAGKSDEVKAARSARRMLTRLIDPGIWVQRKRAFGPDSAFAGKQTIDPQHVANALKKEFDIELAKPHADVRFKRNLTDFGNFDDAVEVRMPIDEGTAATWATEYFAEKARRKVEAIAEGREEESDDDDDLAYDDGEEVAWSHEGWAGGEYEGAGAFVPLRVRVIERGTNPKDSEEWRTGRVKEML